MSSSSELWRHLPLLFNFQRSCVTFCHTSSVVTQLKHNATQLKSLRLMGVEESMDLTALLEALQYNTTLQHITIAGSFLQTLSLQPEIMEVEEQADNDQNDESPILALFWALGKLPHLQTLTLQGTEDATVFPVVALRALLETHNQKQHPTLQTLTCQYVDWVVGPPSSKPHQEFQRLGQALQACTSLQQVTLQGLALYDSVSTNHDQQPQQPTNDSDTTSSASHYLNSIVASLGHVSNVEVGLRYASSDNANTAISLLSKEALQSLLHPSPELQSPTNRLQTLQLHRRIPLTLESCSTIFQSLITTHQPSFLKELQIDRVEYSFDEGSRNDSSKRQQLLQTAFWNDLAAMLACPTNPLQVLDLTLINLHSNNNNNNNNNDNDDNEQQEEQPTSKKDTFVELDSATVKQLTRALKLNTHLQRLCLRSNTTTVSNSEHPKMIQQYSKEWVGLLEHDNVTLQELIIPRPAPTMAVPASSSINSSSNNDSNETATIPHNESRDCRANSTKEFMDVDDMVQFYLALNRQPVHLPGKDETLLASSSNNNDNQHKGYNHNTTGVQAKQEQHFLRSTLLRCQYYGQNHVNPTNASVEATIVPCLEAAMQVPEPRRHQKVQNARYAYDPFDDSDDEGDDDIHQDEYDSINVYYDQNNAHNWTTHHYEYFQPPPSPSRRRSSRTGQHGNDNMSGLFHVLSQHPWMIHYMHQRLEQRREQKLLQEQQQKQAELKQGEQIQADSKFRDDDDDEDETTKMLIPLGGASPQLILLDDDIVALW